MTDRTQDAERAGGDVEALAREIERRPTMNGPALREIIARHFATRSDGEPEAYVIERQANADSPIERSVFLADKVGEEYVRLEIESSRRTGWHLARAFPLYRRAP